MKFVASILGGFDNLLKALLVIMIIEFITKIAYSIYKRDIKVFNINYFIKKIGYLVVLVLAVMIDLIVINKEMIRTVLIYFLCASDALVIIKTWAKIGVPLPKKIFGILNELKEDNDGSKDASEKQST